MVTTFNIGNTLKKNVQLGIIAMAMFLLQEVDGQVQPPSAGGNIEFKEYAVYHVQGKKPYKYRDPNYKLHESKTAYLVTFIFAKELKTTNTQIIFFIGDYRVPEYGGLEKGIYFRFYDPKLLENLNGQTISYQVGNMERISFERKFVTPDLNKMKIVNEETILKKKR